MSNGAIAQAFIELVPQLSTSFATQVRTETTRAGEQVGQSIADAIAQGLNRNTRPIENAASSAGTDAGQAMAQATADAAQREWLRGLTGAAQRAGQEAGREMADSAADGLTAGSGAIEQAAERAGNEAGESLGASLHEKVKSAGLLAGAALGAALIGSTVGAMDSEGITNKLAAQLGASPAMAKEFGSLAGRVYAANYGESLEDVAEALRQVWANGLIDENTATADVEAVTKKAINLANIMGQDYERVTAAISQMLKTGMAGSATEAFDIITKGFQGGADKAGDLLDTFIEYPTQFRKLGIDGATAMGLIQQGLQGGARDADIVADAMKEFGIRAIDGSKLTAEGFAAVGLNADAMAAAISKGGPTAKAALDQVIDGLNNMEDPIARNAAGTALFGTQWEDLGDAFKSLDVSNATNSLGEVAGAADKVDKALGQGASATLETFKRQLTQTFVDVMGGQVLPVVMNVVHWFQEHDTTTKALGVTIASIVGAIVAYTAIAKTVAVVTTAMTVANAAFAGVMGITTISTETSTAALIANKAGMIAASAATKIAAAAQWLFNAAMSANPIGIVIIAIVALVAAIVIAYKKSETFRDIVQAVWKAIKIAVAAVVDWFTDNVVPLLKKYLELAGAYFSFLYENVIKPVWAGIKKVIEVWWAWAQTVFDALKVVLKVVGDTFEWLWKNIIDPVFSAIKKIIETWWTGTKIIFDAVVNFLGGPFKAAWDAYKALVETVWNFLKTLITAWWTAIKALWEGIINFLKTTFTAAWNAYKELVTTVWNAIELVITTWWTVVKGLWSVIIAFLATTFKLAWDNFKALVTAVWTAIQLVITTVWTFIRDTIFTPIITFLAGVFALAWNTFKTLLVTVWTTIQNTILAVWTFVRDSIFTPIINFLVGIFQPAWTAFKDFVSNAWETLKNNISNTWNWIRDNIFGPIQTFITSTIPNAFSQGVSMIGSAWDRLKKLASEPIHFILETVINNGIIKGLNWIGEKVGAGHIDNVPVPFAKGGILPGYTPGRDVHQFMSPTGGRLDLSGGEAVMRPEFTKGLGRGAINFFNRIARTRGVQGIRKLFSRNMIHGGFANGGVVGDWLKRLFPGEDNQKAWTKPYFSRKSKGDGIGDALSSAWNALTDPSEAFRKGIDALLGRIPGSGFLKDAGRKGIENLLPKAVDWIKDKIGDIFTGKSSSITAIGGGGGSGMGYVKMFDLVKAQFPGVSLYSGYRNSYTLSGNKSLHASGRAIDITPDPAIANWIRANYGSSTLELITPWPELDLWHGKFHDYSPAIDAQHGVGSAGNDHIHWAMRMGGLIPRVFDTGGLLMPDELGINRLNAPERVLTPGATRTYDELASGELIDKLDELIDAVERVAPGVSQGIKGATRDLVVKGRVR